MTTPISAHPSPTHSSSSAIGFDHHADVVSWPWCQSCLPLVHFLLSHIAASSPFPPPSPDYICVPAFVHRSQLAIFANSHTTPAPSSSSTNPASPVSSEQPKTSLIQRKTRGVKIACTHCREANKRCDEGRPCGRCIKHDIVDSCVTAERKPRRRSVRHNATATATVTMSATKVALDASESAIEEDLPAKELVSAPAAVHINVSGTSFVDVSQGMADFPRHSISSLSSSLADYDAQRVQPLIAQAPAFAVHASSWPAAPFASYQQYATWEQDTSGLNPPSDSDTGEQLRPTLQSAAYGVSFFGGGGGVFQSGAFNHPHFC